MSEERKIVIGGLKRKYQIHIPEDYNSDNRYPVIFVLHGRTATGRFMERLTGFSKLADEEGIIVIYPDGIERQWNDGRSEMIYRSHDINKIDDLEFITEIYHKLISEYSIDSTGFFIVGLSNGGMLGYRFGIEHPELLKGLAVVSSGFSGKYKNIILKQRFPIMIVHGTADPIIPFQGGKIVAGGIDMGEVLSNEETVKYFKTHFNMNRYPYNIMEFDLYPEDGLGVIKETYLNSMAQPILINIKILNGGHTWPDPAESLIEENTCGRICYDLNTAQEIWEFFNEWR